MTNTMTMQEQLQMSDLEIMSPSSLLSSQLQWNSTSLWSPLLHGGRQDQACMIVSGYGG